MPFVTSAICGTNLTNTWLAGTNPPMKVGTIVLATDGSEYMMVQAVSTVAQFDACVIINTSSAVGASIGVVPVSTSNALKSQRICFAQTAITSLDYGWVALKGNNIRINSLIATQPALPLYTTATAGSLSNTVVTAGYCLGVVLMSSATSASAPPAVVGNAVIRTYAGG